MKRFLAALLVLTPLLAAAQTAPTPGGDQNESETILPQHAFGRFWISGQFNVISQQHEQFRALYTGENSMHPDPENATSHVATLYTGFAVTPHNEILFDLESAGGRGLSGASGLGGFTNLDVVRNPTLTSKPYVARLIYHAVIALSADTEEQEAGPLSIQTRLPSKRLDFRIGKMGVVDFFDLNDIGSDSHLQFMNWTVDNNGAYDYAADTRGYTIGAMTELHEPAWSVRAGVFQMPTVANGIKLDRHIGNARGENVEFELRPGKSVIRLLLYENFADMGSYRQSLALALANHELPDITATRRPGRTKYGAGLNVQHDLGHGVRMFGRAGWNDGRNESFAYTEVDSTVAIGGDVAIPHRSHDKLGIALVSSRISAAHRDYLAAGGLGFILGDGALNYGPENIGEAYYNVRVIRGLFASIDLQRIDHPGYNRDRGPVTVGSLRLHVDF